MTRAPVEFAAPQNMGLWERPENLRLLVVDASYLVHKAYHSPGARDLRSPEGLPTGTIQGFTRDLVRAIARQSPTHLVVAFDSSTGVNARRAICPAYKSSRPTKPADLIWGAGWCKWVAARLGAEVLEDDDLEADDLIASAVAQVRGWPSPPSAVILTGDKDLAQLVRTGVTVWDAKASPRDARAIAGDMGVAPELLGDLLAIAGDSSDDVPGVTGVGVKGAAQLLAIAGSLEALIEGRWTAEAMGKLAPKAQMVMDQREAALMSAELVRLRVVPMPKIPGRVYPNEAELAAFFSALGTRPLLTDLGLGAHSVDPDLRAQILAALVVSYGQPGGAPPPAHPDGALAEGQAQAGVESQQPEAAPEPAGEPQELRAQEPLPLSRTVQPTAPGASVGARLREMRKAAGLTMGDAAARLGVTVSQISDLERDQCPPDPAAVVALAHLYGADLDLEGDDGAGLEELPGMAPADLFDPPPEEERAPVPDLVFGDCPGLTHVMTPAAAVQIAERLAARLGPDYQVEVECGAVISVRGGGYGLVTRCMSRPGDTPDGVAAELARLAASRRVT